MEELEKYKEEEQRRDRLEGMIWVLFSTCRAWGDDRISFL